MKKTAFAILVALALTVVLATAVAAEGPCPTCSTTATCPDGQRLPTINQAAVAAWGRSLGVDVKAYYNTGPFSQVPWAGHASIYAHETPVRAVVEIATWNVCDFPTSAARRRVAEYAMGHELGHIKCIVLYGDRSCVCGEDILVASSGFFFASPVAQQPTRRPTKTKWYY